MEGAFWFRHVDVADGTVGGAEVDTDEKTAWGDGFSGFHSWETINIKVKSFMNHTIAQKPLKARSGQRLLYDGSMSKPNVRGCHIQPLRGC